MAGSRERADIQNLVVSCLSKLCCTSVKFKRNIRIAGELTLTVDDKVNHPIRMDTTVHALNDIQSAGSTQYLYDYDKDQVMDFSNSDTDNTDTINMYVKHNNDTSGCAEPSLYKFLQSATHSPAISIKPPTVQNLYNCDICNQTWHHLKQHMKTHKGINNFL